MLKQELYQEDNDFPECVKQLLASLLTRKTIYDCSKLMKLRFAPGEQLKSAQVRVLLVETRKRAREESVGNDMAIEDDNAESQLVVEGWRLSATTYKGLVPFLVPNFELK